MVKAPPTAGSDGGHSNKKAYERQAECAKCSNPIRYHLIDYSSVHSDDIMMSCYIRGPFATAMNSNWHPDCFCCSACSQPLSNTTFVIEANDVYCEQCYKNSVAPICEGCQQAITGVGEH